MVIVVELRSPEATEEATSSGVDGGDDRTICEVAPIACTYPLGAAVVLVVEVNRYAGTDGSATEVTCGTAGTVRSLGNGGTAGTVGNTVWTAIALLF